jgi:Domain of unknown function (DUF1883)/TIR domain
MAAQRFLHYDLGHCDRGDVIEITLTGGANVRLVDSTNFSRYRQRKQHRYYGGLVKRSPHREVVPSSGRWHVVVDMRGLRGSTRASVGRIAGSALRPLPTARSARPELADIAEALADVSDAWPDKDTVVRPLADALTDRGLRVWYDEFELRIGDSLRRKIDAGIARSRFGIVVLSPAFFAREWPQYELDGLVTMSLTGRQVLRPLWHGVTKDEVIAQSPTLADRVALRTAELTIEEIADEIAAVVGPGTAAAAAG